MTKTFPPHDWRTVETCLTAEIRDGQLSPGQRLPPEPALMARFTVGRHSVRRAVAALQARGLVQTLQGSGSYVRPAAVLEYRLSDRTRFSRILLEQGREPSGLFLDGAETPAPPEVTEELGLPADALTCKVRRLNLADGVPVNLSVAWYPLYRFPRMLRAWRAGQGPSEVLAVHGLPDYLRLRSAVLTRLPSPEETSWLDQSPDRPVLVVRKVDADPAGVPIAFSETVWAGERVQLLVNNAPLPRRAAPGREEMTNVDR